MKKNSPHIVFAVTARVCWTRVAKVPHSNRETRFARRGMKW
jgi:hypothetical protein